MKLRFREALNQEKFYEGVIRKYQRNEDRLLVFVELNEEPDTLYINSQVVVMRKKSTFYKFCKEMDLLDENVCLDLDRLIDVPVIVKFKPAKDGTMFISMLDKVEHDDEEDSMEDYD